jgi:hypothetical protein
LDDDLAKLEGADAETRAQRASELVTRYSELTNEASRVRREALGELVDSGHSPADLARLLGVTRSRIGQLLSSGPRPERALLGSGAITVAIGGKVESGREQPSAVISAESLAAYHLIRDTCAEHKLQASYEVVPPPGMVRLNRDNLIVMGSPRILPLVGQVLEADEYLRFDSSAKGWFLRDLAQDEIYRSPSDNDESCDYAYVGRLPRPDIRGTFLYIAGIHAMGTKGAAYYLTNHLTELYQEVKAGRWSTLVAVHYDADTREISSTDRITPIYKH